MNRDTAFSETKHLLVQLRFVRRNSNSSVQGNNSNCMLLSDELTGDVVIQELREEEEGFIQFAKSPTITRSMTRFSRASYGVHHLP